VGSCVVPKNLLAPAKPPTKKAKPPPKSAAQSIPQGSSFKSQANFRRVFHRKLMQTLSKIESPELQNLKQNLSQDADDFLSALNFE
jgi:hypothetical protein